MDRRTNVQATHYPLGYVREGWEELWGWAEVVKYSDRSDPAVRWLRAKFVDEFPEPVTVLANGAIFVARECRAFFENHPRRASVTPEMIEEMKGLHEGGTPKIRIAELLGVHVNTVLRYTR